MLFYNWGILVVCVPDCGVSCFPILLLFRHVFRVGVFFTVFSVRGIGTENSRALPPIITSGMGFVGNEIFTFISFFCVKSSCFLPYQRAIFQLVLLVGIHFSFGQWVVFGLFRFLGVFSFVLVFRLSGKSSLTLPSAILVHLSASVSLRVLSSFAPIAFRFLSFIISPGGDYERPAV